MAESNEPKELRIVDEVLDSPVKTKDELESSK